MEVHRELGCGYLECVYHDSLAIELEARGIPHQREVELPVGYKAHRVGSVFRVDFVCFDSVLIEIKALASITTRDESQLINYLKASGFKTGLLLNFGSVSLECKRRVL